MQNEKLKIKDQFPTLLDLTFKNAAARKHNGMKRNVNNNWFIKKAGIRKNPKT